MSFKDDPLQPQGFAPRVLWLDQENMLEAATGFGRAYQEYCKVNGIPAPTPAEFNHAFAAAVAAHSYIMEGRLGPGR